MESFTLHQLNEYIRRVIALNFREPVWIESEIIQVRQSRGNIYLELAQKDENSHEVIAQGSAAIWFRNYQFIKKKLGDLVQDLLVEGTQVRLKCQVDFNERYGLKLFVQDVDPTFTFGKIELGRQQIIERLQKKGLMELNKSIILSSVIQRIAVITSTRAAGYQDFINHLRPNAQGYTYILEIFDSAVQGTKVEKDTCRAIRQINDSKTKFDAVVIIRGGGSRLDLSGYDNYEIARSIALSTIPFIIGIGHDIDQSVTDMVACLSMKTPTAVADFLIEHNLHYENQIEQRIQYLIQGCSERLSRENMKLQSLTEQMSSTARSYLLARNMRLERYQEQTIKTVDTFILKNNHHLERLTLILEKIDPQSILKKGYAMVTKKDQTVKSVKDLKKGDEIKLILRDGIKPAKII